MYPGVLADFGTTRQEAEQMVLAARLKAGWITEADLAAEDEEAGENGENAELAGA
jgi:N utilization substance protein A